MVKVREDMTGWIMSEHGFPDSRLTVLYQTEMINSIQENVTRVMFHIRIDRIPVRNQQGPRVMNESRGEDGETPKKPVTAKKEDTIGRNDPCPCGSGKKYKKCCGKDQ